MARKYSQIFTAIWRNPEFRALDPDCQLVYLELISQPDISSCGVLPLTLRRWAANTTGMTVERLSDAIQTLSDTLFVVVDWDAEELLVRSFARWDGGINVPNRRAAVIASAHAITSEALRQVMAHELDRLGVEHKLPDIPFDSHSDAIAMPSPSNRVVVTKAVSMGTTTQIQEPQPESPSHAAAPRATRLPADWQPTDDLISWVKAECPDVDGKYQTAQFIDYWLSKAGKDAAKIDWSRTYQKWMRTAQQESRGRPRAAENKPSTSDARVAAAIAAGERLAAQYPKAIAQ